MQFLGNLLTSIVLYVLAFATTLGLSIARIAGNTSVSFQALAHLFVGMFIGVAVAKKDWAYGYLAIALCVVEVVMFIITRVV